MRWPNKIKAGSENNKLVCLTDMMATFANLYDVKLADDTAEDSWSFYPSLFGKSISNPRTSIVHHSIHGRFAIREDNWKLLLSPGSGGWTSPIDSEATSKGLTEIQLYNLKDDIGEQNNLKIKYPEKVKSLLALLENMIEKGRSTQGEQQSNDVLIDIWKTSRNYLEE